MNVVSSFAILVPAAMWQKWRCDLRHQRTRTKTFGPRALAVLGPSIWNTLPATVRDPLLTYGQFCSKLKSVIRNRAYNTDLNSCAYMITICYKASAFIKFCLLTKVEASAAAAISAAATTAVAAVAAALAAAVSVSVATVAAAAVAAEK